MEDLIRLLKGKNIVDLTHTLQDDMPVYPTHSRYVHALWDSHNTGSLSLSYQLMIHEHCGTHVDATAHFLPKDHPNYRTIADTSISQFHGRALTLSFTDYPDNGLVSRADIEEWENKNFRIEHEDIVFFHFGWDRYWVPRSVSQRYSTSWPGLSGDAASYLASKQIKAVGCDTLAIDSSYSANCPAHYELLGNDIVIFENLTNLQQIVGESYTFAFPLKIAEGSASPVRAIAII